MTERAVTLAAVGDTYIIRENPGQVFSRIAPLLKTHDLVLCNLESQLYDKDTEVRTHPLSTAIRMPTKSVQDLIEGGFNIVCLANSHGMDYGIPGVLSTYQMLEENAIAYFGSARNSGLLWPPVVLTRNGLRMGFLGYDATEWTWIDVEAYVDRPGMARINISPFFTPPHIDIYHARRMQQQVRAAAMDADFLCVMFHWGHSVSQQLTLYQRELAHQAIDAGADLILGAHPHILQGVESYKGKFIFYSLGDFVFDGIYSFFPQERMIVRCAIQKKSLPQVSFIPVVMNSHKQPEAVEAGTKEYEAILDNMKEVSRGLGTRFSPAGGEVVVTGAPNRNTKGGRRK